MLDKIITELVVEYNFQMHMAKYGGRLLAVLGDGINRPVDSWKGYPCYRVYFICNNRGFLRRLGNRRDFPEEETEKYNLGRFKVAVDQAHIHAAQKAGIKSIDFLHEKIINVRFYKKDVPRNIVERMEGAAAFYNAEFAFNPDYCLFTAGDLFDEDSQL